MKRSCLVALAIFASVATGFAQAPGRGTAVLYPVLFDDTGTSTSRAVTKTALGEVLSSGGFRLVSDSTAASAWKKLGVRTPSYTKVPKVADLARFGSRVGARYVVMAQVHFHTRSIWVNLGPKTVSNCDISVTIVDATKNAIVYEQDGEGRSDEKSDALKVAGALLITPLITAVSGGPKTPQESRAGQIAAVRSLQRFVTVN
ncbi:MAG TPA: hypothetical protein PLL78_09110 [Fimbriimonadaceae bacterium]|nr:hypothetical protein [Fimbriimonadaceae bacterium]HRJ96832.1 hypothetical protein [Fimbriimonadaceae bacterium]